MISQSQFGNLAVPQPSISIVTDEVTLIVGRRCERDPHHFTVDFTLKNSGDIDGFATVELVIRGVTEARSNIDIVERIKFFVEGQSTESRSQSGSAVSCIITEEDVFVRIVRLERSSPGISVVEVGETGINTADLACFRITPGGIFNFAPDEFGATSEIEFTVINTSNVEASAIVEMLARGEVLSSESFLVEANSRTVVSMIADEILCGITAEEVVVRIAEV